ncbi:MAG: alpha/beta hydrolase [bacterium]
MELTASAFKFVDNNALTTICFVPGWATNASIYEPLFNRLKTNLIIPHFINPYLFQKPLIEFLGSLGNKKTVLLGWSMGGFLCADFFKQQPQCVSQLILAGMRQKYDRKDIDKIKNLIGKNKTAYLYKFYKDCFSVNESDIYSWFKNNLLKNYLNEFALSGLVHGLDFLSEAELDLNTIDCSNVTFVHGAEDKIAPYPEFPNFTGALKQAEVKIIPGAGHAVFLNPVFKLQKLLFNGKCK